MATITKIKEDIKKYDIKFIKLLFTDLEGFLRNLEIPAHQLDQALKGGQMFDGSSIKGFAEISKSDLFLNPDKDT
jgi:glutamine synthetase